MEQIVFYEYSANLKKGEIVKYKCIGTKIKDNLYSTRFYFADNGKNTTNPRIVNIDKFEIIHSFRIFSFNDDYEKYRKMLIEEYELMVEKNRLKLQKQEQFLEKLKQN